MTSADADLLASQADAAAARGDLRDARDRLQAAVEAQPERVEFWLKLAPARQATGDSPGALDAVMRALAIDPLDFMALLLKAKLLDDLGDPSAGEVYGHALAQRPEGDLPAGLARMTALAERKNAAFLDTRETMLRGAMADAEARATLDQRGRLARFRSNVLRRTRTYHSEPTHFQYPGLVEREFHDRAAFPWLDRIERDTAAIVSELEALLNAEDAQIEPYVQYADDVPMRQWKTLNHSLDWSAIHLLRRGEPVVPNVDRCPVTMAALADLPQPYIPGYSPNAMFSVLVPGAHIPPHHGVANTRLVCHLPLVIPDGCWFRVGAETRGWRPGECLVFDDTIEHEAANPSMAMRAVLIFDLWHPGLDEVEREGVAALMTAGGASAAGDL